MSRLWIPVTHQRANPTLRPFLLHGQCFSVFLELSPAIAGNALIPPNVRAELCRNVKGPTLTGSGLLRPAIASPGQRKIGVRDRRALRIARARAQIAWGSSKGVGRSGSHH